MLDRPRELSRGDAPVRRRETDELGAAGKELGGAAFIRVDMRNLGAEDATIWRHKHGQRQGIRGGAGGDREGHQLCLEDVAQALSQPGCPGVGTVGADVTGIGGDHRRHDVRRDGGHIVAAEIPGPFGSVRHARSPVLQRSFAMVRQFSQISMTPACIRANR